MSSYYIPPQISDFRLSSPSFLFYFGWLPAGGSTVSSMNTFTASNASRLFGFPFPLSFYFGRLPAGGPKVAPYEHTDPTNASRLFGPFLSLFPFLLAGCRLEAPRYPPIIYRLKFLIFGFPLSFSFSFCRLPAGGSKVSSYYIPPQISDFRLSSPSFLLFWPAAGWRLQGILLLYTTSNF